MAHELTGSAASIGAQGLARACRDLEQDLLSGDVNTLRLTLAQLGEEFMLARGELVIIRADHGSLAEPTG